MESANLEAARSSTRGSGWASNGKRRAAESRQARPEEAQQPKSGPAKGLHFGEAGEPLALSVGTGPHVFFGLGDALVARLLRALLAVVEVLGHLAV
eukprot:scaffold8634_cov28-Phaeocystis_antarctica.AAC.1